MTLAPAGKIPPSEPRRLKPPCSMPAYERFTCAPGYRRRIRAVTGKWSDG